MSPSQYYYVQKYLIIAVIIILECISVSLITRAQEISLVDSFNAENDAITLQSAMEGLGTDEEAIIDVLANRGIDQRLQIAKKFEALYGTDLISELKSELSGDFEDTVVALMMPLPIYYAKELHDEICRFVGDDYTFIEILSSLSNSEIKTISDTYENLYGSELEDDIKGIISGDFKDFLLFLLNTNRDENSEVDEAAAIRDAEKLLENSEEQWGRYENTFSTILITKSYPQLRKIFQEYERIAGYTIEDAIERKFSGLLRDGYLAIVRYARDKTVFFAVELQKAMCGWGTDDSTLIRIIVGRSEIDLNDIKNKYQKLYGNSLAYDIDDDTSGDYRTLLLALL